MHDALLQNMISLLIVLNHNSEDFPGNQTKKMQADWKRREGPGKLSIYDIGLSSPTQVGFTFVRIGCKV